MSNPGFEQMDLDESLLKALRAIDYLEPSPIQAAAIPIVLTGVDIIGQAQTGTGKTAAFGIPMIQNISREGRYTKGLVLCPTRELCIQVSNELKKLSAFSPHINVLAIYGGESIVPQIKTLKKGVEIVVGTPGRVQDHIDRGTLQLGDLEILALDEADEMLNMGFREDLEKILQSVPVERRTILFSATMPKAIMDITHQYQKSPQLIKVTPTNLTALNIEQFYIETDLKSRFLALEFLLTHKSPVQTIVFCNTKAKVDELSVELADRGIRNNVLHGDLTQDKRNKILTKFRNDEFKVLVATDVAARGIDVPNVEMVINYDISFDPEYYVHRIGRTGRAGKAGTAYSFLAGARDKRLLRQIENFAKSEIKKFRLPDARELAQMEMGQLKSQILHILENKQEQDYIAFAKELVPDGASTLEVLAAVLIKFIPPRKVNFSVTAPIREQVRSNDRSSRGKRSGGSDRFVPSKPKSRRFKEETGTRYDRDRKRPESGDSRPARDGKYGSESKPARDGKYGSESKPARDGKYGSESKFAKESKPARDGKYGGGSKFSTESKPARESSFGKENKFGGDSKPSGKKSAFEIFYRNEGEDAKPARKSKDTSSDFEKKPRKKSE